MSRVCELTGIKVGFGNNVSHSQRKIRRRFLPNLHVVSFYSKMLDRSIRFRVVSRALKTVDKHGGVDSYLLSASSDCLSKEAMAVRSVLKSKMAE